MVCHSTGALRHVRTPDGKLFGEGKTVTGFTNGEEDEVELTKVVPFLVEDEMMRLGATFSKVKNWAVHTVVDGQLITGQNPASSGPAARLLIDVLNKKASSVKAIAWKLGCAAPFFAAAGNEGGADAFSVITGRNRRPQ